MNKLVNQGYTLLELLIVISLIAFVVSWSLVEIARYAAHQEINRAVTTITTTLTETRQRTLAAESDTQFGIGFATTSVSWFEGLIFDITSPNTTTESLGGVEVAYAFSHNEDYITFSRLRGEASATGTVAVTHPRTGRTIVIEVQRSGFRILD